MYGRAIVPKSFTTAYKVEILIATVNGIVTFKVAPGATAAVVTYVPTKTAFVVVGLPLYNATLVPDFKTAAPLLVIVAKTVNAGHEPVTDVMAMVASLAAVVP